MVSRKLLFLLTLCALWIVPLANAEPWTAIGPHGGDVRSLAYDPHNPDRIFLGTSSGRLFVSADGGGSWSRFAHLGDGDDYVLDHIAIDPRDSAVIYVSAWSVEGQIKGGDIFRTRDGGKSWQTLPGMHGRSVRAMAMSVSNPELLVAGALDGVFRSSDDGATWQRVSPANHAEIKNIESVAVDPRNPNVIYAGTWHLAWKTVDGGVTWNPIRKGMIDDSDVFSIIVDRDNSSVVYASACSGIYKSESSGELFRKIQGIPFSARRTRVLHQDPSNPAVVYAGTTEGLWRTQDTGKTWNRVSDANIIVNDVLVDPRRSARILLATDRSGVLASNNGGQSFLASNQGFAHRQVSAMVIDRNDPSTMYVGLVNDKEFGGVFVSRDGGAHWQQQSTGLGGRDVFTLKQAASDALVVGTNRGMFVLQERQWRPANNIVQDVTTSRLVRASAKSNKKKAVVSHKLIRSQMDWRVADLEMTSGKWFAATSNGLFTSADSGKSWQGGPVGGYKDFVTVRARGDLVVAASHSSVVVSNDGGLTWAAASLPRYVIRRYGLAVAPDSSIWISSREGAWRSTDAGKNWEHVFAGLPATEVAAVTCDEEGKRLLATSRIAGDVFESNDLGRSWRRTASSGFPVRALAVGSGRVFAMTSFDGVVAQSRPDSKTPNSASAGGGSGSLQ
jgi:photosystem II stability/assembly factor-like uncharacterized protein